MARGQAFEDFLTDLCGVKWGRVGREALDDPANHVGGTTSEACVRPGLLNQHVAAGASVGSSGPKSGRLPTSLSHTKLCDSSGFCSGKPPRRGRPKAAVEEITNTVATSTATARTLTMRCTAPPPQPCTLTDRGSTLKVAKTREWRHSREFCRCLLSGFLACRAQHVGPRLGLVGEVERKQEGVPCRRTKTKLWCAVFSMQWAGGIWTR